MLTEWYMLYTNLMYVRHNPLAIVCVYLPIFISIKCTSTFTHLLYPSVHHTLFFFSFFFVLFFLLFLWIAYTFSISFLSYYYCLMLVKCWSFYSFFISHRLHEEPKSQNTKNAKKKKIQKIASNNLHNPGISLQFLLLSTNFCFHLTHRHTPKKKNTYNIRQ